MKNRILSIIWLIFATVIGIIIVVNGSTETLQITFWGSIVSSNVYLSNSQ